MPSFDFSDPRIQRALAAKSVAVLATLRPSGAPLAMAMWFVHDEEAITMISLDGLQKVKNLRRDPRACVVVEGFDGDAGWSITVEGHAVFVDDPDRRRPLIDKLFERYGAELEGRWTGREMPSDRVMFQIVPERVFYWGFDD